MKKAATAFRSIALAKYLNIELPALLNFAELPRSENEFRSLTKNLSRQDGRLLTFWSQVKDGELRTAIVNLVKRLAGA